MRGKGRGLRPVHVACCFLLVSPPAARLGITLWSRGQPPPAVPAGAEALAAEVASLQEELRRARAELELHAALPDPARYRVGLADVVPLTDPSPRRGALWVTPRKSDAAARDSSAFWDGALAGRVLRVERGLFLACIQTLADPGFRVRFRAGEAMGILHGTARRDATGAPLLVVRHLSREKALGSGDVVFTAGDDGIYPPGLRIGEVLPGTEEARGGRGGEVLVRAALRPEDLAQVLLAFDVSSGNLRRIVAEGVK